MGTLANLTGITGKLLRRLGDETIRQRVADLHRGMATMGRGSMSGYLGVSRDLLRTMAAEGMTHPDECLLLMELAASVRRGAIVEIGSYRGRSTIALAAGSARGSGVPVYAIEPHADFEGVLGGRFGPRDRLAFDDNIARSPHASLVHLVSAPSGAAARSWEGEIGLLWIDADHRYEAVLRDFELWSRFLHEDAPVAFDDSTVAGLGPHAVIQELLATGRWTRRRTVGKVTVLGRRAGGGSSPPGGEGPVARRTRGA